MLSTTNAGQYTERLIVFHGQEKNVEVTWVMAPQIPLNTSSSSKLKKVQLCFCFRLIQQLTTLMKLPRLCSIFFFQTLTKTQTFAPPYSLILLSDDF